jgi:bacteriocin biosynthesis cyclodehydratase domain-containing protein
MTGTIRRMRPLLDPARRAVWRDPTTLQLGADPERAVVLAGVDGARASVLALLDGTRTVEQVEAAVRDRATADPRAVRPLVELLDRAGVLVDASHPLGLRGLPPDEGARLGPDLAAASFVAAGEPVAPARDQPVDHVHERADAVARLRRRRERTVAVVGAGRVGATVVALLAAAGVGTLRVADRARVGPGDVSPGGHATDGVGHGRAASACAVARDRAPSVRTAVVDPADAAAGEPDLLVLSPDGPRAARSHPLTVPHLLAAAYEGLALVGPLVRPGRTPCLGCLDLHRTDRDPGWAVVAAQLTGRGRRLDGQPAAVACDGSLAAGAAALTTVAALAVLDDPGADHDLDGAQLELRPPAVVPRRRSWGRHPRCGCGWDRRATMGR